MPDIGRPLRLFVTGFDGLLGTQLAGVAAREFGGRVEVAGISQIDCEIDDRESVERHVRAAAPDAVVHLAACAFVDECEADPDMAERVNAEGARTIADICAEAGCTGVFISSDYVFDGSDPPYSEDGTPNPLNVYGRTKVVGERAFARLPRHVIVRTAWLFGGGNTKSSYVLDVLEQARGGEVTAIDDQRGSPTYSVDLARRLIELLLERDHGEIVGTWHIVNRESCTWYDLARAAVRYAYGADAERRVRPIGMDQSTYVAPRPVDSTLATTRLDANGGRMRTWRAALAEYITAANPATTA